MKCLASVFSMIVVLSFVGVKAASAHDGWFSFENGNATVTVPYQSGNRIDTWTTPDKMFGGWSTGTSRGTYSTYPGGNFRSYKVTPRRRYQPDSSWDWDSRRWYWNR